MLIQTLHSWRVCGLGDVGIVLGQENLLLTEISYDYSSMIGDLYAKYEKRNNKTAQKSIKQVKWFCMWCCWVSWTKQLFQGSGVSSQDIPPLRFGPNNLGNWRWVKLECRRHPITATGREAQWELQLNIYDSYDSRNDSKFSGWIPRHRWPRSSRFLCKGTIQKWCTQILF